MKIGLVLEGGGMRGVIFLILNKKIMVYYKNKFVVKYIIRFKSF